MRNAFIKTLTELAGADPNIHLLTGDLGFTVFEEFMQQHPEQYLNCGVAEQNMVGMAAGLAMSGKKVFVYSIVPFAVFRALEQIRNDICVHNLDVKIVGIGGGYSYGPSGPTHHSIEDIAVMKGIPNMRVLVPADPIETDRAVRLIARDALPAYLRLGKSKEENLHPDDFRLDALRASVVREGKDVTIIAAGPILNNALKTAELLAQKGIGVRIVSMTSVKPLDKNVVLESAARGPVFTLEEHNVIGGLGDSVAAVIAESGSSCPFKKFGVSDAFMKVVGDQDYLRAQNGLAPEQLTEAIRDFLGRV